MPNKSAMPGDSQKLYEKYLIEGGAEISVTGKAEFRECVQWIHARNSNAARRRKIKPDRPETFRTVSQARYGFVPPDFLIPGPYNVTFKRRTDDTVTVERLREQVLILELNRFHHIIGLGGKLYRMRIEAAFTGIACTLEFPFSGLPIGKAMAATKAAMLSG